MLFHKNLSDTESIQITIFESILAGCDVVVACIVLIPPQIADHVFFPGLWVSIQENQLLSFSPTPSCFTIFSALRQDPGIFISYRFL